MKKRSPDELQFLTQQRRLREQGKPAPAPESLARDAQGRLVVPDFEAAYLAHLDLIRSGAAVVESEEHALQRYVIEQNAASR